MHLRYSAQKLLLLFIGMVLFTSLHAQHAETGFAQNMVVSKYNFRHDSVSYRRSFPVKSFILPATMFLYGLTSLKNDPLKDINENLKEEIWTDNPHKLVHIDNYLQFSPAVDLSGARKY